TSPTATSTVNGSPALTVRGAFMTGACDFSRGVLLDGFFTLLMVSKRPWSTFTGKYCSAARTRPATPAAIVPRATLLKKALLSIAPPVSVRLRDKPTSDVDVPQSDYSQ